jgi:FkbM family methyltransferase
MEVLRSVGAVVRRSPLAPLYPAARRVALSTIQLRAAADRLTARALRVPLSLLPVSIQANLKYAFAPTARLDYAPHRIRLHVDSAAALYRTHACRKEPETVRWIEEYVRPGDVMYDVGANVGAYSLIAAKHCGGDIRVIAFEPNFATYDQLCRNIVLNGCEGSVVPYPICLTEAAGPIAFGHSSLEPGSALHVVGGGPTDAAPVYTQSMLGFSVDFLVKHLGFPTPHHMKIDVDGTEADVLRGATEALDSDRLRTIQVEVSPGEPSAREVDAILVDKGFRLAIETARGGGTRWSNRLFVREPLIRRGSEPDTFQER